jgi:GNAT superfamily N-acetyltransferase
MKDGIEIRGIRTSEITYLSEALLASIHVPGGEPRPDASILSEPQFAAVTEGWGRRGDFAMVAIDHAMGGGPVGAAWVRLYTRNRPTFGYVADDIPVLDLAVSVAHRGRGIGTRLMRALIGGVTRLGYSAISLSVDPGNRALRLYARLGFTETNAPRLIPGDHNPVLTLPLR